MIAVLRPSRGCSGLRFRPEGRFVRRPGEWKIGADAEALSVRDQLAWKRLRRTLEALRRTGVEVRDI